MSLETLKNIITTEGFLNEPYTDDHVYVVMLRDSVRMKIVSRTKWDITLRGAVDADVDLRSGVVVDGSFCYPDWGRELRIEGYVVKYGEHIFGHSFSQNGAFLVYAGAAGGYGFGMGNTPRHYRGCRVDYGIGGLVPMILDGQDCLNAWYVENNEVQGRCIVGHDTTARRIVIIVQDEDRSEYNLDQLREFAKALGCTEVVVLDGGASAMLKHRGTWRVRNSLIKDFCNPNAVGFYSRGA